MKSYGFRAINLIQKFDFWPLGFRNKLLKLAGIKVGPGAIVMANNDFLPGNISIGPGAYINGGCLIDGSGGIDIRARVYIGYRAMLITSTHEIGDATRRAGPVVYQPILIEDAAWIGAGSQVLPGVTVGSATILAAGSVATKSLGPDGLYAGIPAALRRELQSS